MLQASYSRLHTLYYRLVASPLMRRVLKNTGYLFSATGGAAVLGILISALRGRLLGVAGVGLLGIIFQFTSVINKFASFRMDELVVKYVGHYTETQDAARAQAVFKAAALTEMLASGAAFGLIWLLSPWGAGTFAKNPNLASWFGLYGLIVLSNLISESSTGLLQIFNRYRRLAFLNLLQSAFTLLIISLAYLALSPGLPALLQLPAGLRAEAGLALAFLSGGGLLPVILAYLGGKTITALGLTVAALAEARRRWGGGWWRIPLRLLAPQARELSHFAISTNLSASLSLITKDSELLWLAFFQNQAEAGYYITALTLVNLVQMPVSLLPQAIYPELSRQVARRDWAGVRAILWQGSRLAGGFSLAAILGLALLGKPLILLLFKDPKFLPAYPALLILMAGFLVDNTFFWQRPALLALGRPDFPTKVNLGLAVLKLGGILLLVPRFGYLASAGLVAGSYLLGVSLSALKVRALLRQRLAAAP